MANTIGRLQFEVDANTAPLRARARDIQDFRNKVTRTAKDQVDASNKVVAALVQRESAMKRAFLATLRLQQAQRSAGGTDAEVEARIRATDAALKQFTMDLKRGQLNTKDFNRAQDAFASNMDRSKRALKDFNDKARGKNITKLSKTLRNLESSAVLAVGPLSGVGARLRSLGAIASRTNIQMVALFAVVTAGVVALFKLGQAAFNAGKIFETSIARFQAATGSLALAKEEMAFVIKVSRSLGLRIDVSAKAFSRLTAAAIGTKLEGEGIRKVFVGISKAAAALRLGQGEVEGTFRAIEQMLSKGTVQAEELRGQLGERLPGAFRLWAKSMGVTTRELGKLLKAGEVFAERDILRFIDILDAQFGAQAIKNLDSLTGSTNEVANAWLEFSAKFNEFAGVSEAVIVGLQTLTHTIDLFTDALDKSGSVINKQSALFAQAAANIANPIAAYLFFRAALNATTEAAEENEEALTALSEIKIPDPTENFGKGFKTSIKNIDELSVSLNTYNQTLDKISMGSDPALELAKFTAMAKLAKVPITELAFLAARLREETGLPLRNNLKDVAVGLAFLAKDAADAADAFQKLRNAPKIIENAAAKVAIMVERLEHMGDPETLKAFDSIDAKVNALAATFAEGGIQTAQSAQILANYRQALIDTAKASDKLKESEAARKQGLKELDAEERSLINSVKRQVIAMRKADEATKLLQERVAALASGPKSLEVFNKVTKPLAVFTQKLKDAKVGVEELNERVAEHKILLQQVMVLTGEWAQASVKAAQSIGNALEDVLSLTMSLKDGFHSLLDELWRILLRLLIIDPIVNSISTAMTAFFTKIGGPGAKGAAAATAATAAKATTEKAEKAQEQATRAQEQATVVQFQAAVTQFQAAITQWQASITLWQAVATEMTTAVSGLNTAAMSIQTMAQEASEQLNAASEELMEAADAIKRMCQNCCQGQAQPKPDSSGKKFLSAIHGIVGAVIKAKNAGGGFGGESAGNSNLGSAAGRAFGGSVFPGQIHQVTERSPEVLYQGNKQFLLTKEKGTVVPLREGSGRAANITNIFNLPPERRRHTVQQEALEMSRLQIRAAVRNK